MDISLDAKVRLRTGNQLKSLRSEGLIPGVVYGKGIPSLLVSVSDLEFTKMFKQAGENTLISLKVDDQSVRSVIIQDVSVDPVKENLIHVDFYQVKLDQKVKTEVPISFIGESRAVKDLGGTLIRQLQTVEIESLPTEIPHEIEVDISSLKTFDDNIKVGDIAFSDKDKVKILSKATDTIALISPPR